MLKVYEGIWYLSQIACLEESVSEPARALAALLCKNRIAKISRKSLEMFLQECAPRWFQIFPLIASDFLRKAVGGIIVAAAVHADFARLEILKHLLADLSMFYPVLLQICEDCAGAFTGAESELLISTILQDSQLSKAKKAIILTQFTAEQVFSMHPPETLIPFFANDSDEDEVAQLLLKLCQYKSQCEPFTFSFWLPFYYRNAGLSHALLEVLNEYIDTELLFFSAFISQQPGHFTLFLRCLLERCVLTDENELCRALEDLSVPDQKPQASEQFMHDSAADSDEEEGQINELDDTESLDSLRNCSLAIIQVLTLCCPTEALSSLILPILFERLESSNVFIQEAFFMVFAVCTELTQSKEFCGHLPNLLHYAFSQASHTNALIRSSSLQCLGEKVAVIIHSSIFLGNFANFLMKFEAAFPEKSKLSLMKQTLIALLQDSNKRVQEAACRVISQFIKQNGRFEGEKLLPAIFWGLARFQVRNRRLLYAIVAEVAEEFEAANWRPIFELLVERFDNQAIQDSSIFPLIGALVALQPRLPFSQNLFAKTCALALNSLKTVDYSEPFLASSLDLLDAIVEVHSQSVQVDLLASILEEAFLKASETETLQSAFALFGDLNANHHVIFDSYWTALNSNYRPTSVFHPSSDQIVSLATASNAIWSFGLLCLQDNNNRELVKQFQESLLGLLEEKPRVPLGCSIYFENIAIALGRSARIAPLVNLSESLKNRIFKLICKVEDPSERESSLQYFK